MEIPLRRPFVHQTGATSSAAAALASLFLVACPCYSCSCTRRVSDVASGPPLRCRRSRRASEPLCPTTAPLTVFTPISQKRSARVLPRMLLRAPSLPSESGRGRGRRNDADAGRRLRFSPWIVSFFFLSLTSAFLNAISFKRKETIQTRRRSEHTCKGQRMRGGRRSGVRWPVWAAGSYLVAFRCESTFTMQPRVSREFAAHMHVEAEGKARGRRRRRAHKQLQTQSACIWIGRIHITQQNDRERRSV